MEQELLAAAVESAHRLNVEPEALAAVALVESSGRALTFVNGRREPLIRFEGHYFDRRLNTEQKAAARALGLSSPTAGSVKNPASQTARWALLERAAQIDRQAAYESTSFGVGQVMGAHWSWLGYTSVEALVDEARAGLAGQIRLMERYIEKSCLSDALRRKDWAALAEGYNGPGFKKNAYDRKIADAFDRLKTGKAAQSAEAAIPVKQSRVLRLGMKGEVVADMQRLLCANGYALKVDSVFGAQTSAAVKRFQQDAGLAADGVFGPVTKSALETAVSNANPLPGLWSWLKSQSGRAF